MGCPDNAVSSMALVDGLYSATLGLRQSGTISVPFRATLVAPRADFPPGGKA